METQHFLFKSYPQHKFCNIIKSKWLILDNDHCQLNSELVALVLACIVYHVSLHCEETREACDRNSGSFSKVRISARISCSFHPSSETLWKLLWNSMRRKRRRRRRDSRRPARRPLLAGHYQRTITGPRLWIAKKETEFSNHALYDSLCTGKLNHF